MMFKHDMAKMILLIEDEESIAELVGNILRERGKDVVHFKTGLEAGRWLKNNQPDLVVLDYFLPDMEGSELVKEIRAAAPDGMPPFIVTTGAGDERIAVSMMKIGAKDYLIKDSRFFDALPIVVDQVLNQINIERKLAEAEIQLLEKQKFLEVISGMVPDIIYLYDIRRRKYLFINHEIGHLLGYSNEEIKDFGADLIFRRIHPDDFTKVMKHMEVVGEAQDNIDYEVEYRVKGKQGHYLWFYVRERLYQRDPFQQPEIVFGICQDITKRRLAEEEKHTLEEQLRHTQKMEAVGKLAGGIAHEFNNLLYIISGNAEILLDEEASQGKDQVQEILLATQRGANLVELLLAFSRKVEVNLQKLYLNRDLQRIAHMLEKLIPRTIAIELDLGRDVYPVVADQMQMEQVLINLALNSKDAMPDGGKLIIKTENGLYDKKPHVILTVSDSGQGMDQATVDKIFEPFFTTKQTGQGTGLGLAVVYGIIKAHNGFIACQSEVGKGTIFTIHLPGVEIRSETAAMPKIESETLGHETVLVVDDEASIIKLMQNMLAKLGYDVIAAESGEKALGEYERNRDRIDLVILDLGMPGMGGQKCLESLLALDPEVKVIVASGYTHQGLIQDTLKQGARNYLVKPYNKSLLSKTIRQVLDEDRR